ncbi:MAG: response regulator receiver sensor signal transduction histidine kinase [Deltaproteobacteria bacterium]|nr:response regulator receiver sensor signal transduction histidine kinase [Deltaproteobacteria bacterium]
MASQGNILIIEDEPGPALALKMILKPYYQVYSAERGEAALEILKTTPIDVVSLDLRMPGLSGMPLLAKIKAQDPDIEVIIITGYGSLETAVESIDLKVFSYVAKPFDVLEILETTKRALQKRRNLQRLRHIKEEFFANLTHEFRTPLSAIMGYSSILLEEHGATLTSDQRQALDRIQANSHELLSCVEGIFFLAALEAGEIPLTVWSFDAKLILSRLSERHADAFAEKNVRLEINDLPSLPIRTDEEKLAKIIDILVLNGLKFTEEGSVRVDATRQVDGPLEIRVRDTGIGMRPDEVEEVLEGFRQADPTARKRFRGIGLGLRLLTRMVAAIGGTLDVTSTLGGGTEFVVTVPPIAESTTAAIDLPSQTSPETKVQLSA